MADRSRVPSISLAILVGFCVLFSPGWAVSRECESLFFPTNTYRTERYPFQVKYVRANELAKIRAESERGSLTDALIGNFKPQETKTTCWAATAVNALNALAVRAGLRNRYSERDLVLSAPSRKDFDRQIRNGLTLDEVKTRLENRFDTKVSLFRRAPIDVFRSEILRSFQNGRSVVAVNFISEYLNMSPGGHFSTIAKYNHETDEVLVLDVAAHENPPFWVKLEPLLRAMEFTDSESKLPRGFLVLERPK